MASRFQWLVMSVEKDDVRIIDAESDMWGERSLKEKLLKTEGKQAVLYKDNKLRTYLVVQQGVGNMSDSLEELKVELGLSGSTKDPIVDVQSHSQNSGGVLQTTIVPCTDGNVSDVGSSSLEGAHVLQCCEKHKFEAELMLEDENRIHKVIKLMEQSSSKAAEEMSCLKRKLHGIVQGAMVDIEFSESELIDSTATEISSQDSSDDNCDDNNESLDEASVYSKIGTNPPVQFGLNKKNLDLIYSGHDPWEYGLELRKWIFGANGLAYQMILPTKSQGLKRTCVTMDQMLTFFLSKFPMRSFPEARRLAKRAANKAGLNVKQRMEKTGKYSQEAKLKKQQARKQKKDSE